MFYWSNQALTKSEVWLKATTLTTVSSPLLASVFIHDQGEQSMPVWCPIRWLTGIPCPGCGMGRSFVAIAHGDWQTAMQYHAYGPVVFLLCLLLGILTTTELIKSRRLKSPTLEKYVQSRRIPWLVGLSIISYHLYRLRLLSQGGAFADRLSQSSLLQLFT